MRIKDMPNNGRSGRIPCYFSEVVRLLRSTGYIEIAFDEFEIPVSLHPLLEKDKLFVDAASTRTLLKSLFRLIVNIYTTRRFVLNEDVKYGAFVDAFMLLFEYADEKDELLLRIGKDIGAIQ